MPLYKHGWLIGTCMHHSCSCQLMLKSESAALESKVAKETCIGYKEVKQVGSYSYILMTTQICKLLFISRSSLVVTIWLKLRYKCLKSFQSSSTWFVCMLVTHWGICMFIMIHYSKAGYHLSSLLRRLAEILTNFACPWKQYAESKNARSWMGSVSYSCLKISWLFLPSAKIIG